MLIWLILIIAFLIITLLVSYFKKGALPVAAIQAPSVDLESQLPAYSPQKTHIAYPPTIYYPNGIAPRILTYQEAVEESITGNILVGETRKQEEVG